MKIERATRRLVRPELAAAGDKAEWVALSSADLQLPVHVELLLAYEAGTPQRSELEEGLRKALSAYREWAGRIEHVHPTTGRPAIALNDAGVAFIEAQAHGPLHLMLPAFHNPSQLLRDLIPPHLGASELLLVQVTWFTCGGMTVGVAWHHQIADGEAAIGFVHTWALIVKGLAPPNSSSRDRSLMMARHPPQPIYDHEELKMPPVSKRSKELIPLGKQELVVVRRLHFSAEFLQQIKVAAKRGGEEEYTRFESLMGHLWRSITRARGLEEEEGKDKSGEGEGATRLTIIVNARKRMNPRIKDGYFGNAAFLTCATSSFNKLMREPLGYASKLVKEAIKKVNEDYVRSSLDYMELKERQPFEEGRMDRSVSPNLSVTSWATFPLYEIDFGTGCPLFAGNAFVPVEGLLIILPHPLPSDGSLDVVLGLFESAMDNLLSIYGSIF